MFTSDAQDGLSDDTDVAECAMLLRRLCVTTPWANLPDHVWRLVLRDLTLDEAVALLMTCRRHRRLLDPRDLAVDPEWRGLAGTIAGGASLTRLYLRVDADAVAQLCVRAFDEALGRAMSDDARLMLAALMVSDPPRFEGLVGWPMAKDVQYDWIVVLAERAALVVTKPTDVVLHSVTLLFIAQSVARVNPPHLEVVEPLRVLIERAMACWPTPAAIRETVEFVASLPETPMSASLARHVLDVYTERRHTMREDIGAAFLPQGVVTKVVPCMTPKLIHDLWFGENRAIAALARRIPL